MAFLEEMVDSARCPRWPPSLYAPRRIEIGLACLVHLDSLAVELFLDDELVLGILALLERAVRVLRRPVAPHRFDDVREGALRAPAEHRAEDVADLDGVILRGEASVLSAPTSAVRQAHLAREALVNVEELVADAHDVGTRVEEVHRVRVKLVEDGLLAHADLEVYER